MEMQPIRVAIADDHALFRSGVRTALNMRSDVKVLAEAENGQQLLTLLKHLEVDVVLLDIQMPIMDGLTTLPELKKQHPGVKVVMLSMHNDDSMISRMMELGANSYLTKDSDAGTIYQAINTCMEQDYFFTDLTNKAMLNGLRNKQSADSSFAADAQLSDKEMTVLRLMCEEKSTKEIADIVDLSPRTVEAIRDKLKIKTGSKTVAGLVMYAVKHGILH